MTFTITLADYEEAIKYPWSTSTCLLAQAIKRHFGHAPTSCSAYSFMLPDGRFITTPTTAPIVWAFDKFHGRKEGGNGELLASLPYSVEIAA